MYYLCKRFQGEIELLIAKFQKQGRSLAKDFCHQKKEFFEKIYINREVVQEARCIFIYVSRVEETNRSIIWRAFALDSILNKDIRSEQITLEVWLWRWGIRAFSSLAVTLSTLFYNGEFDPGSGWTLATGLTHASRGETTLKLASMVVDRRTGE